MKLKVPLSPMKKISKRFVFSKKAGQPPGSLIYTGKAEEKPLTLELIQYNSEEYSVKILPDLDSLTKQINADHVNWIHINNLSNTTAIEEIGNKFGIHTMTLEDILDIEHMPKIEESDNCLFLTMKIIQFSEEERISENHISLILKDNFLLSFADTGEDIFYVLKSRLESAKTRARSKRADYLFYLILDNLVDNYYPVFDKIYNKLEEIENLIIKTPSINQINNIYQLKKEFVGLRKSLVPLEKSVNLILKDEYDFIDDANEIFIRDVYDHLIQHIQTYDSCRDFFSSLIELNSSNLSNNLNKTMKVLTTIATIFIPLTFIAGVYGMNFHNMPELSWRFGYFYILGLMTLVGIFMLLFMKRKGFFK